MMNEALKEYFEECKKEAKEKYIEEQKIEMIQRMLLSDLPINSISKWTGKDIEYILKIQNDMEKNTDIINKILNEYLKNAVKKYIEEEKTKGIEEGKRLGKQEGKEEGLSWGEFHAKTDIIQRMLLQDIPVDSISKCVEMDIDYILKIKNNMLESGQLQVNK